MTRSKTNPKTSPKTNPMPSPDRAGRRSQRDTPKVVRWVDLLAALLRRATPAAFDDLRREVPAYGDASKHADAIERMFERDKEELRAFGVPVQTVPMPDSEHGRGYVLRRRDFYLPYLRLRAASGDPPAGDPPPGDPPLASGGPARVDHWFYRALQELAFGPDELAVVQQAAARVRGLGDTTLGALATSALRKLAVDLPVDAVASGDVRVAPTRARADRKILDLLGGALAEGRRVALVYHAMGRDDVGSRDVEPWGLFFLGGHWYLAARDPARGEGRAGLRNFRVDRMRTAGLATGPGARAPYTVPADFRLAEHARSREAWALGGGEADAVVIAVRGLSGAVLPVLRTGEPADLAELPAAAAAAVPDGSTLRRLRVRRQDAFLRWAMAFAGEVVPVAPAHVVEAWRAQLRATRERYARDTPTAAEGGA